MADYTLAQMRNRVLEKLFVLIAGETAEAEDVATVEACIAAVNETLRQDEICYWDDTGTPEHLVEWLGQYYACFLANDYMDAGEALTFKNDPNTGMKACIREIRALTALRKRVDEPTRALHF
jgi:predicted alpha-1,6-mannanase (GH76 family)